MSTAAPAVWSVDPVHTNVQFSIRHMMVSNVKGSFTKVTGSAEINDADITRSHVEATIQVDSIETREPQRDAHLRSADFFDAEKYPVMKFRSTKIEPQGEAYAMTGDLTIKGVTKPITLTFEPPTAAIKDPYGKQRRGFEASGQLNRKDFGLEWNMLLEAGGVAVGDTVKLSLDVELVRD